MSNNRIDLEPFQIRTDLVIDYDIEKSNVNSLKFNDSIKVTTVFVNDNLSVELKRKVGTYVTIEFVDVTNHEDRISLGECLTDELKKFFSKLNIPDDAEGLIIGLGNRFSTADSLGPKCIDKIMVTRHLFELNMNVSDGIRSVVAISPGVMADTGIETFDIIVSIVKKIKPKFLVIIDSLASSSIDRINKTIQITDTGIHPGSGVGNHRKELSEDTLGIPVLSLGVPTVVESSIIVSDTIEYLFKHLSYIKNHYDSNKLVIRRNDKYREQIKNLQLSDSERREVSGILGTLGVEDKKSLMNEVLQSIHYDMIVTPKEIDFVVDKLSEVIADSVNKSLHFVLND